MKKEIEKISHWIQSYVGQAGSEGVVVGLSGGVDSAVSAALAVRSGIKVKAFALPCGSAIEDLEDAELVAKTLEIPLTKIDLESAYNVLESLLFPGISVRSTLVGANIKARLRMITLYAQANSTNRLVLGTGNKSELAVGYITKWGDGAVDFEPLGQYYKTEVVQMAEELGLPEKICHRVPSPGLIAGVTDESELGMSYAKLDKILMAMDHGWEMPERIEVKDVERVCDLMNKAAHKKSLPPSCPR